MISKFKNTNLLLNSSHDVNWTFAGVVYTDERRKKISKLMIGRKLSLERRLQISNTLKTSESAKAVRLKLLEAQKRAISVNGVSYKSVKDAADQLKLGTTVLRRKALIPNSGVYFLEESKTKNFGIPFSEERKRKLSEARRNSEKVKESVIANGLKKKRKKILLNGTLYSCHDEACEKDGVSKSTLRRLLRESNYPSVDGVYVIDYITKIANGIKVYCKA